MACLGAKNITVCFQEGEHHEQGTHTPKGVLVPRWDLGFMPVPGLRVLHDLDLGEVLK